MRQGLLWDVPVVCEDRIHKQKMEEHMWSTISSVVTRVLQPHPWSHSHAGSVNNMILHSEARLSCSGWQEGMRGYCRHPPCPSCGFSSLWLGTLVQEVANATGTLSISRWFYHGQQNDWSFTLLKSMCIITWLLIAEFWNLQSRAVPREDLQLHPHHYSSSTDLGRCLHLTSLPIMRQFSTIG